MSGEGSGYTRVDRRGLLIGAAASAVIAIDARAAEQRAESSLPQSFLSMAPLPQAWIRSEAIPLWDRPPGGSFKPVKLPYRFLEAFVHNVAQPLMRVFRPARSNGRGILIIPGGGYMFVSVLNEGLNMADRLTAQGYTVFVLVYRLPAEGWTDRSNVPLQDAQRAMRLIRSRAADYRIDPADVAAIGFSAGGHLAASLATRFSERVYSAGDRADELDARPFAVGLIYPVVTLAAPHTHGGSRDNLLGPKAGPELVARYSPELHVASTTPRVFLVHAFDDKTVPVQNSFLMLDALRAAARPVEAHFFEEGGHGFGVGAPGTAAAQWLTLFSAWLERARAD